ncbi:twin-arginine translocase TatA/TatE family subunit [Agromyces binzhouensis]|uniref:Sec-independent protein translocase protein TatA n=1 Tax=Agromyces binzhouensis TaxID=1817495 RepID=A0A4Q2JJ58_9MICO|nr:twin-arginine translocase TatA/TatE family subunit [Agromyces binzhouensis]RXZ46107.1 twin-arginine translocase TatA/TatE family subunit [Agromyces binzhouensis]
MFGNAFTGWHALIILLVILLLFGAPKLPALARSLGQSMKILKNEVRSDGDETDADAKDGAAASTEAPASSTTSAPASTTPAQVEQPKRADSGPSA